MVNVPYADPETGTELLIIKSVDDTGLLAMAIDVAKSTGEPSMAVQVGDAIVKVNGANTIDSMRQNFLKDNSVDLFVLKNENIARFLRAAAHRKSLAELKASDDNANNRNLNDAEKPTDNASGEHARQKQDSYVDALSNIFDSGLESPSIRES